jgi:glycine dehydrogenase subunit 2
MGTKKRNAGMSKPLITELDAAEEPTAHFGQPDDEAADPAQFVPATQRRQRRPPLPHLDEPTLRAHFADAARLAPPAWAGAAVAGRAAGLPGLVRFHPRQPAATLQGLLEVSHGAARALAAMTGLDRFTLQPPSLEAAERAALLVVQAWAGCPHPAGDALRPGGRTRGEDTPPTARREIVAPAESTALAAAQSLGLAGRPVPRLSEGDIDLDALLSAVGEATAAVVASWLTPSGAFERHLAAAAEVARAGGALFCVDARGLGALVGRTRLREAGADVAWLPFSELCPTATSAALGVRSPLTEFLPGPLVGKTRGGYELDDDLPRSVGRLALAPANALDVLALYVRASLLGEAGLRARAERLVLEANALAHSRREEYPGSARRPVLGRP